VAAVPGVQAASFNAGALPMSGDSELPFWIDGQPKPATDAEMKESLFYVVEPDYLKAMGVSLLRGRFLSPTDNEHSPFVIVIDEQFAKLYFPGQNPIGRRVHTAILNQVAEIVGIAGHVKQWGLAEDAHSPVQAQFYMAIMQTPSQFLPLLSRAGLFVVRTEGSPEVEMGAIRRALDNIHGDMVVYDVRTMDKIISDSLAARRFSMVLLGLFAALALVLSCVGIYGVISYLAGQRTHEIGVRIALGAQRKDVLRLILGHGAKMALVGVGAGLAASLALTRLMAKLLFGVRADDPLTFAGVACLLVVVALAASYIPARRALRVDPTVALKYD